MNNTVYIISKQQHLTTNFYLTQAVQHTRSTFNINIYNFTDYRPL